MRAWASALLVLQDRAMRRPLCVGRVTGTDSHAFLFYAEGGSLSAQNKRIMIYQLTFCHGAKEYSITDRVRDKVLQNQCEAVANGLLLTEIARAFT